MSEQRILMRKTVAVLASAAGLAITLGVAVPASAAPAMRHGTAPVMRHGTVPVLRHGTAPVLRHGS